MHWAESCRHPWFLRESAEMRHERIPSIHLCQHPSVSVPWGASARPWVHPPTPNPEVAPECSCPMMAAGQCWGCFCSPPQGKACSLAGSPAGSGSSKLQKGWGVGPASQGEHHLLCSVVVLRAASKLTQALLMSSGLATAMACGIHRCPALGASGRRSWLRCHELQLGTSPA